MAQFIFPPLTASLDSEQVSGGALPTKQMIVGGYHAGGTKVYPLAVDADGKLDIGAISPGTGATSLGKAIQSAQGTTDTGVAALVVRNDTLADLSGADGDYAPLQVNATGALYTDVTGVLPGVGATNLGKAIQSPQGTTDVGVAALVVRNDTCADLAGADHDYAPLQVNNVGQLYTFTTLNTSTNSIGSITDISNSIIPGVLANNLGKAMGDPHGATHTGVASLVVRNDTLADLAGADHDYAPLQVNATGALYTTVSTGSIDVTSLVPGVAATNLGKAIQSPQGATDVGVAALVVRNDTLADLAGADHDYAPLQVNATGALYTSLATAIPAGTNTIGNVTVDTYTVVDQIDSTLGGVTNNVWVLSGTNDIPASTGTAELILGSAAVAIKKVQTVEDIGEFMGLWFGASTDSLGTASFGCVLPLGGGEVPLEIPYQGKVWIKALTSGTAIISGNIAINFLG